MHATGGSSIINTLMSLMTRSGQTILAIANCAAIRFQTAVPHLPHHLHHGATFMPRELRSMYEAARPQPDVQRHHREDPQTAVNSFIPTLTTSTWTEEYRLFFGSSAPDCAQIVVNAIVFLLVPPAIEEARITKEKKRRG